MMRRRRVVPSGSGGSLDPSARPLVKKSISPPRNGCRAREHRTRMPDFPSTCPACASLLAHDQRYCLGCGARVGAQRVEWATLQPVASPPRPAAAAPVTRGRGGLPRPRAAAALILATLGVGTLAGAAAGPSVGAATERAPIIALAPVATAVATPTPTPADGSALPDDDGSSPAAAPDPQPEPAPAATAEPEPPAAAAVPAATASPSPRKRAPAAATPAPDGPPAKHVVVVTLTGHDATAFAADSPAAYLARELPPQGALLRGYRATTTGSLANALSLLAGAEPTDTTRGDCPDPADATCRLKDGAVSLPSELADSARAWKAYVQGLPAPCSTDPAPGYAPARNPFAFMGLQDCATSEASTDALEADFADTDLAPAFAYVVPDLCHDGREQAECPGLEPIGLERADAWLREWVPKITGSKAFADDGLLVVLFDGGNLPAAAEPPAVGAVVVSSFARKGAVSERRYDHLSLLRTIAGSFGVDPPAAAGKRQVKPFGHDVLRSQDVPKSDTSR
jgi:phosphatidylinositol-3-phosphatase